MPAHSPAFLALVEAARGRIEEIDASELPARLAAEPDALLIDTREESEWRAGHLRGAIHLSKGIIERDIEARCPARDRRLYLYCGGGYRSALVADNLRQMGYSQAISVDGGWRALQSLLPVSHASQE